MAEVRLAVARSSSVAHKQLAITYDASGSISAALTSVATPSSQRPSTLCSVVLQCSEVLRISIRRLRAETERDAGARGKRISGRADGSLEAGHSKSLSRLPLWKFPPLSISDSGISSIVFSDDVFLSGC